MLIGSKVSGIVRRIFDTKNKHFTTKFPDKKLLICYIVIFLLLELLFIPIVVTSSSPVNGFDTNNSTTDSSSNSLATDDKSSDSSDGSIAADDKSTNSDGSSLAVDDTSTSSGSNSYVVDDKSSDSSNGSFDINDTSTESSDISYVYNKSNNFSTSPYLNINYNASNERTVSIEEIVSIAENNLGDITSGQEKEVTIEYYNDIDSVRFTAATNLKDASVTIIKLKDKPEEIIDPPKKNISVYKYLDIKLTANDSYVQEDDLKSLEFKFKVEKTWIKDYKIDKETIRLIRYHDGIWQNLSTTLVNENETYVYYSAESPGFSTFAVVGSKVVEKSESYDKDEIIIPWSIIFAFIIVLIVMLVIILFKARYIYLKEDNK